MLTEHGGWGQRGDMEGQRRGRGRGGSRVVCLNDSHVTKPSRTLCVCVTMHSLVFLAHKPFTTFFLFLMISAVLINSCVQSTNMFQT